MNLTSSRRSVEKSSPLAEQSGSARLDLGRSRHRQPKSTNKSFGLAVSRPTPNRTIVEHYFCRSTSLWEAVMAPRWVASYLLVFAAIPVFADPPILLKP